MKRTTKPKTIKEIKKDTKKLSNGSDLSERHKKFAEEYIYDWNATRAYKVAYPGVVDNTAATNGHMLLSNTKIKAYIEETQKDIEKLAGISRLKVALEFMRIAFDINYRVSDRTAALVALTKYFGYAEPEKVIGMIAHTHAIKQIQVKELAPNIQEMLLQVGQKQLADGVRDN